MKALRSRKLSEKLNFKGLPSRSMNDNRRKQLELLLRSNLRQSPSFAPRLRRSKTQFTSTRRLKPRVNEKASGVPERVAINPQSTPVRR